MPTVSFEIYLFCSFTVEHEKYKEKEILEWGRVFKKGIWIINDQKYLADILCK